MWNHIQTELAHILSNQLFPMLKTDPGYMVMLRNAGLTSFPDYEFQTLPNGSTRGKLPESVKQAQSDWAQSKALKNKLTLHKSVQVLSDATRTQLETAARLCAQLAVMHIDSQQSLRERRAEAIVLEGPVTIYRLWDSIDMNQTRNWWFSENLLHEARTKSESAGLSEKEWLRDRLAVSLNSGRCDKLSRLNIAPGSKLPAVAAWGLPMPKYTPVRQNPRAGEPGQPPSIGGVDNRGGTGPDYWASMGQLFLGEKTQYFLPFLPPERISPVA